MARAIIAKTHPPEYLLHKYWARKPHNVIAHYIMEYFKKGDLLCDPFCGSGVFLAEAKKQGIDSLGFDINPIAALISKVTTDPPLIGQLTTTFKEILDESQQHWKHSYQAYKEDVRYCVHVVETRCNNCQRSYYANDLLQIGHHSCPTCKSRISFNFENLISTKIVTIVTVTGNEYNNSPEHQALFEIQRSESTMEQNARTSNSYDIELVPNRRILAFPNMKTSDLFTRRAFAVASDFFDRIHEVEDPHIRQGLLVFMTSCVAQFSRLIPFRNNLRTGGPAWTIPGFWIAPVHLETNPFVHIKARWKKFHKAIENLQAAYSGTDAKVMVSNIAMQDGMSNLQGLSLDGVFFDPPYGDNVPYLEFSSIWNTFLRMPPDYGSEIVVSDRKTYPHKWEHYEKDINEAIGIIREKLKPDGKIIMTFNNLEPKAWKSILSGFKYHGFDCIEADYQIPAVTSTKSQFANKTSYIGDFYCVFTSTSKNIEYKQNPERIINSLLSVFLSRGGVAPKNLILRTALLTILQENLSISIFDQLEDIFNEIAESDNGNYILKQSAVKQSTTSETPLLKNLLVDIAQESLALGKISIEALYQNVIQGTAFVGTPSLDEVKELLADTVLFKGKWCWLLEQVPTQTSMIL